MDYLVENILIKREGYERMSREHLYKQMKNKVCKDWSRTNSLILNWFIFLSLTHNRIFGKYIKHLIISSVHQWETDSGNWLLPICLPHFSNFDSFSSLRRAFASSTPKLMLYFSSSSIPNKFSSFLVQLLPSSISSCFKLARTNSEIVYSISLNFLYLYFYGVSSISAFIFFSEFVYI